MKQITFSSNGITLKGNLYLSENKNSAGLLFLHGGGTATKERFVDLQEYLLKHGFSSFAFDFQGVGDSEGEFSSGSLHNRLKNAKSAFDELKKYVNKIIVIGTSMGGHVAARLTESRNVNSLILLYAATYAKEAEDKPLNEEFTKILRAENSWQTSLAFSAIERYTGQIVMIYGENDNVVPKGLQQRFKSLINKERFLILANAGHLLLNPQNELQQIAKNQVFEEILSFFKNIN